MENDKDPLEDNKVPIKINLTDADKDDQENFKEALIAANINANVTVTESGQDLMDNLQDQTLPNPDIIFMDGKMPLDDGEDCLKEIKLDEILMDIPTIVYAVSSSEKDIENAFTAGASRYIPKPIFFRNLVLLIRKIFGMYWKEALLKPLRKNFLMSEVNINPGTPIVDVEQTPVQNSTIIPAATPDNLPRNRFGKWKARWAAGRTRTKKPE